MKNWTVNKRITFGFAALLALTTILGIVNFVQLNHAEEIANNLATDPLPGGIAAADINNSLADADGYLLRAVNTQNLDEKIQYVNKAKDGFASLKKGMDAYEPTIHIEEDRVTFSKLKAEVKKYEDSGRKVLQFLEEGKQAEAQKLADEELDGLFITSMETADKMLSWNFDLATRLANESAKTVLWVLYISLSLSVVVIIIGIIFSTSITRGLNQILSRITHSLDEGADHVSSAASQVSTSSQSLAEGASEQAASIEETSASLNEISGTIERNSQTAQATKELAQATRSSAEQGVESTQEMNRSIDGIKTASQDMGKAMDGIKAASSDIANIIKTIDEIAFQTNLLALNAAVEAARAGEAGAGFAVVADEVRNLAQRSAKAAKETAAMIETAIQRSNNGVAANQKVLASVEGVVAKSLEVSQKLQEIVGKVAQVDEQVAQIAAGSKEQSQGIGQITTAVGQMEQVTQANASGAEESAAAAEELSSQAEVLKNAVKELQTLVGGKGTAKAAAPETAQISMPPPQPRVKSFAERSKPAVIKGSLKN